MTDAIMQAFLDVQRAMERYNQVLEEQVAAMRSDEGSDPTRVERMVHGAKAMRDSSSIYLSYAKFVAYGMPDSEEQVSDDLQA